MYCIQCGVELSEGVARCPLCKIPVIYPVPIARETERMYPPKENEEERFSRGGVLFAVTAVMLLAVMVVLLCDFGMNHGVHWSGYAVGGLVLFYCAVILPQWFRRPNPVIFFPVFFAACLLFLLYVNLHLGQRWFLSFAFPVTGGIALLVCAVVVLLRYLKRGRLFVIGGALVLSGPFFLLVEFFSDFTFSRMGGFQWAIYPMSVLCFFGLCLLTVAFCRPLRDSLRKKLFL